MKYYSAIKNEEVLPFVTAYMEFKGIMLSEISPTEAYESIQDKYCMTSLMCGICKTTTTTTKKKLIENESIGRKFRGRWSNGTNFQL